MDKKIKVYKHFYRPENIADGDIVGGRRPFPSSHTWEPDDGPVSEWAADLIDSEGCTEASSYPDIQIGHTWYSGTFVSDNYTGEQCDVSAHLSGFTPEEERETYSRIVGR
jgi:hypothetical protein